MNSKRESITCVTGSLIGNNEARVKDVQGCDNGHKRIDTSAVPDISKSTPTAETLN